MGRGEGGWGGWGAARGGREGAEAGGPRHARARGGGGGVDRGPSGARASEHATQLSLEGRSTALSTPLKTLNCRRVDVRFALVQSNL